MIPITYNDACIVIDSIDNIMVMAKVRINLVCKMFIAMKRYIL